MSRIRTIKPEFWSSEQVMSCSPLARLLFIGLWNFSDDHGVHPASCWRLKAEVFPSDDISVEEIGRLIGELIKNKLLYEYLAEERNYWIVTGWKKHQRIEKPTYRFPLPSSDPIENLDDSDNPHRELDERSQNVPIDIDECSATDRKGMEGIGKEKDIREADASPGSASGSKSSANTMEVFSHWQKVMGHPNAKLDKKRKSVICRALRDYGTDALKQAIDGCSKTPHNMGANDSGQRYDDVSLIFRDAEHIERFMVNALTPPQSVKSKHESVSDIMEGAI